jgi:hypothetical protein
MCGVIRCFRRYFCSILPFWRNRRVVSWPPVAFYWNGSPGVNTGAEFTPAPSGLVLLRDCSYSTRNTDRTLPAKDAANDIQCAVTCGYLNCARLPGIGKDSSEF